jgi:hypothetical protein
LLSTSAKIAEYHSHRLGLWGAGQISVTLWIGILIFWYFDTISRYLCFRNQWPGLRCIIPLSNGHFSKMNNCAKTRATVIVMGFCPSFGRPSIRLHCKVTDALDRDVVFTACASCQSARPICVVFSALSSTSRSKTARFECHGVKSPF